MINSIVIMVLCITFVLFHYNSNFLRKSQTYRNTDVFFHIQALLFTLHGLISLFENTKADHTMEFHWNFHIDFQINVSSRWTNRDITLIWTHLSESQICSFYCSKFNPSNLHIILMNANFFLFVHSHLLSIFAWFFESDVKQNCSIIFRMNENV